jgi:3-hydroxy-9,10-secoandrosta-1,3,5(10)-triene-9,17-dione monooxygenase
VFGTGTNGISSIGGDLMSGQTTMMAQSPTDLIACARSFIPHLIKAAPEAERERRLSQPLIDEMRAAGLFSALQPARWGGHEASLEVFYDIAMALAEGDMSAGWVYGVAGVTPWLLGLMDDRAAADVWGHDSTALVAACLRQAGEVRVAPTSGGARLSGRWSFASGCLHCSWAFLGAVLPTEAGAPPDWRVFLVSRQDFEIVDTWHSSGLRATGSHDIVVREAFVPDFRIRLMADNIPCVGPGQRVNTAPLYRLPVGQVIRGGAAAPAIGALRAMLDDFVIHARNKVRFGGRRITEDPDAQLIVGEADATVDELDEAMRRNARCLLDYAARGEIPPPDRRILYRFHTATVAERCRLLAARIVQAVGASGLYTSNRFGRIFADITASRQHIANQYELEARRWGRYLLGVAVPDDPMQ